jgi:mRNA-degrading endonuclease RelE of RelBE toxin-antitoxin system
MKKYLLIAGLTFCSISFAYAQKKNTNEQANYTQIITKRSEKIVTALNIADSVKFKRVVAIIADQYRNLSDIYDTRDQQVKDIKSKLSDDKVAANKQTVAIDSSVDKQLDKLHNDYLAKLGTELTGQQIDEVKDQMTYRVLPLTYNAYLDEIPTLTDIQKKQIKAWLVEAREHAIDAGSSEKKHAWFGKYKGRINNYLSAQGYDMKKEGAAWQQRIKDKAAQKG